MLKNAVKWHKSDRDVIMLARRYKENINKILVQLFTEL